MSSADPKATFNQVVSNIQGGQKAMDIVNEYGNGDPKVAFANYATKMSKDAMAQQIMARMGLHQ